MDLFPVRDEKTEQVVGFMKGKHFLTPQQAKRLTVVSRPPRSKSKSTVTVIPAAEIPTSWESTAAAAIYTNRARGFRM